MPSGLRSLHLRVTLIIPSLDNLHFAPRLHHLSLHASHANDAVLLSALLAGSSQTLTSLGLKWGRCTSFQPDLLPILIEIAPQLEDLHLHLLEIPNPSPPTELATLLVHCKRLRSLTIEGLDHRTLIPILSSLSLGINLAVLELQFPLFYDLACAEVGRSFCEALKLPAMQSLKRWRMSELKAMKLDEGEGRKWREECERRVVDLRDGKRIFGVDG